MTSPTTAAARRRELLRRMRADAGLAETRRDAAIPVRAKDVPAPLSAVQHSLWTHHRMYPGSTSYNGCLAIALSGPLDVRALRLALDGLVAAHEVLRTTYRTGPDGEPRQTVRPAGEVPLPIRDLTGLAADRHRREAEAEQHAVSLAARPFDLAHDHPVRYELLRFAADEHALIQVVHHIAWDGGTWGVLSRDLAARYAHFTGTGTELPPTPGIQYADFAAWSRTRPASDEGLAHWRKRLTPPPTPPELPADGPRPPLADGRGGRRVRTFRPGLSRSLREFAASSGVTPFTAALAAYTVVLHRHTGGTDVPVGTLVMDRAHPDLAPLVGNFGNTVVLRADLASAARPLTFRQVLDRLRDVCAEAFAHQDTPFDTVLDEVRPPRQPGRTPLFDTMFGLLTQELGELDLPGLRTSWRHIHNGTTQFDLALEGFLRADGLLVEATYRKGLFGADTVDRLLGHLETVLEAAIAAPDTPIDRLPLLTDREVAELTAAPDAATSFETVAELVDRRIAETPGHTAVVAADATWSYADLDARAAQFADTVADALGATPEPVVAIALPRGADLVAALVGVLRAGAAYLPLDLNHPPERIALMLDRARPDLLLCADPARLPAHDVPVLSPDRIGGTRTAARRPVRPDSPAYVIFTSGSTGHPKAVLGTQRALANRLRWGRDSAELGADRPRVRVAKSALTFIDGSTELLGGLVAGDTVVVADDATAADPAALAALLGRHRVDVVTLVPSLLDTLLDTVGPTDLDSVTTWVVSGEPLPTSLAAKTAERCPRARLVNLYGCSEAAGDSLAHVAAPDAADDGVPIGRPIARTRTHVLDAHLQPVPTGVTGELYLAGDGLARGYLGGPVPTAERFVADPYGPPGTRLYRTGDLVRRLADGTLAFVGRADHQLKIRGIRVEPAEIEHLLLARPEIARAVVTAHPDEPALCAYVVPAPGHEAAAADLRGHLARSLPAPIVPGTFVVLDALPLNPNGKVDRAALPAPGKRASAGARRAPGDPREAVLHAVFAEFLRLAPEDLGTDDDFFALGGHSLLAARVANRARADLAVEITLADVFAAPTVAGLARLAATAPPVRPRVRDFAGAPGDGPASFAQEGLWFDEQVRGPSAAYCLPLGIRVRGTVDADALRAALRDVVTRHAALRTVLCAGPDDLPVRQLLSASDAAGRLRCDVVDAAGWDADRLDAEVAALVARPFRVDVDLPLRAGLFRQAPGAGQSVLVLVLHHAAADRWSFAPLLADLSRAYAGRVAAPSVEALADAQPVDYAAYTAWQRALLGERNRPTDLAGRQLDFWQRTLSDAPAELPLPADRRRPAAASHRGGTVAHRLSPELASAVRRVAHDAGASVFMVLHAAVAALLHRHGAGDDVILGAPVSGRTDEDLDDVVGFFVNSVVLRTDLAGDPTFADLVARVRAADLAAFAHADVPFERVVERLRPERSASRHPLFQVMIAHHRADEVAFRLAAPGTDDGPAELFLPPSGTAMFDLDLRFVETADAGIELYAGYATDRFDHATVRRLTDRLTVLLDAVTADPDLRLGSAPILPGPERELLLREARVAGPAGVAPAGPAVSVVAAIARRVAATPDAVALVDASSSLSRPVGYAELDARVNRLAHLLIDEGVRPGDVVGVAVPRSAGLVTALLAVLKTGAAYLPIDLDHPDARIADVIADAAPVLTVVTATDAERLPGRVVVVDGADTVGRLPNLPKRAPEVAFGADHPAYVMYTSGSTGRPKGVVVSHGALANQLAWVQSEYRLTAADRVLHKSPVGFDVSVWELFWPLCSGATIVVTPPDAHRDAGYLAAALGEHRVTAVHFVPPVLDAVLGVLEAEEPAARPAALRLLLCGGEALPPHIAARAGRVLGRWPHNTYGPTEATITATSWTAEPSDLGDAIPIGRPVANTGALVLDERLRLTPLGHPGELYLTGAQLAQGYLGRPALTAERFVANPYGGPGERMYRTGDVVRRRTDGALVFLGRTDAQVKLRGVRIELGEIEAALAAIPAVRASAVVVRPGPSGAPRLVAYVTPAPGAGHPDPGALRDALAARLPEHMVPAEFVTLDVLPRTATGKTDLAALPDPADAVPAVVTAPEGPVETTLAGLFADVLRVGEVSTSHSFFVLGGDSIGATLLAARARKTGLRFTVRDVFRHPTVAALARVAVVVEPTRIPVPPPAPDAADAATPVPAPPLLHVLREHAGAQGPNGASIALVRELPGAVPVREDALRAAAEALVTRHPALGIVVTPVSRRLWRSELAPQGGQTAVTVVKPVTADELSALVDAHRADAAADLDVTRAHNLRVVGVPGVAGAPDHVLLVAHPLALDEVSLSRVADALVAQLVGGDARDAAPATAPATPDDSAVDDWTAALRGAVALEPPVPKTGTEATRDSVSPVTLPAPTSDAHAVAATAFLHALRGWAPDDAELLVIDRMIGAGGSSESSELDGPVGAFASVYPLAFSRSGPLPDVAAWDARGAAYPALRHASRAGARELARTAKPVIVLRDAARPGPVPLPPSWGTPGRWAVDAAVAVASVDGAPRYVLSLTAHVPLPTGALRDLLDRWAATTAAAVRTALSTTSPTDTDSGRTT